MHYAVDAVMVSTILAGIKQSTGLSVDLTQITEPNVRNAVHYYLATGQYVFDRASAFAQSSTFFRPTEPVNPLSLFGNESPNLRQYTQHSPNSRWGVGAAGWRRLWDRPGMCLARCRCVCVHCTRVLSATVCCACNGWMSVTMGTA